MRSLFKQTSVTGIVGAPKLNGAVYAPEVARCPPKQELVLRNTPQARVKCTPRQALGLLNLLQQERVLDDVKDSCAELCHRQ